jgi:hypothetical protein
MRFILWEMENSADQLAEWFMEAFQQRGFEKNPIVMRIEKAITDGEIRPIDPLHLTLNLLGMCVFPFIASPVLKHILPGFNEKQENFIELRTESIYKLIWESVKIK